MTRIVVDARWVERFSRESEAVRAAWIEQLPVDDLQTFDALFDVWANPAQLPRPGEGWDTWLMMAGRGFGKTRAGAEWVHRLAMQRKVRIALAGATIDEARTVMVEGQSGVLSVAAREGVHLVFEASLGRLRWPNGSVATLYSGDSGEGLRGPEHHYAWCVAADRRVRSGVRGRRRERGAACVAFCGGLLYRWTGRDGGLEWP